MKLASSYVRLWGVSSLWKVCRKQTCLKFRKPLANFLWKCHGLRKELQTQQLMSPVMCQFLEHLFSESGLVLVSQRWDSLCLFRWQYQQNDLYSYMPQGSVLSSLHLIAYYLHKGPHGGDRKYFYRCRCCFSVHYSFQFAQLVLRSLDLDLCAIPSWSQEKGYEVNFNED